MNHPHFCKASLYRTLNLIFFALSTVLLTAFVSNCSESEVLASYEGGKGEITRGEFRKLVRIAGLPDQQQVPVEQQTELIKTLGTIRLTALEVKELPEADQYKLNLASNRALINAFNEHLISQAKFKMMYIQAVMLAGEDRDADAERIQAELNELSDEKEINDKVSELTEAERYKTHAGYIQPLCVSCSPSPAPFLTGPLLEAEVDQFQVIKSEGGYYIARKVYIKEAGPEELTELFEQHFKKTALLESSYMAKAGIPQASISTPSKEDIQREAQMYASAEIRRETKGSPNMGGSSFPYLKRHVKEIKDQNEFKVLYKPEPAEGEGDTRFSAWSELPEKSDELFSLNGKVYTYADFVEFTGNENLPVAEQFVYFDSLFVPVQVLKVSPEYEKVTDGDMYEFLSDFLKNQVFSQEYFAKNKPDTEVTAAEIQQYYNIRSQDAFKGKPLAAVSEQIKGRLAFEKREEAMRTMQDNLFKKYKFEIKSDRLSADEL